MKNCFLIITLYSTILACKAQNKPTFIVDNGNLDFSKIEVYNDTLFFDINNDGYKDALLKLSYKYQVPVPEHESGQILALFINNGKNEYIFETKNNFLLWLIHNEVKSINPQTFIVINEGTGQDWNRYFCYFEYDKIQNNWLLTKYEVFKFDDKERVLLENKTYSLSERIVYEKVNFDNLFGKFRAEVPEPPYYENIKSGKAPIYSKPNFKTKMFLIKGDEVKILEEKDNWLKIRYYGKKAIEGWIKRSDIE